jgi:hypothetical protein
MMPQCEQYTDTLRQKHCARATLKSEHIISNSHPKDWVGFLKDSYHQQEMMGGSCSSQRQRRNGDHSDNSNRRRRSSGVRCRPRSFSSVVGRLCGDSRVGSMVAEKICGSNIHSLSYTLDISAPLLSADARCRFTACPSASALIAPPLTPCRVIFFSACCFLHRMGYPRTGAI